MLAHTRQKNYVHSKLIPATSHINTHILCGLSNLSSPHMEPGRDYMLAFDGRVNRCESNDWSACVHQCSRYAQKHVHGKLSQCTHEDGWFRIYHANVCRTHRSKHAIAFCFQTIWSGAFCFQTICCRRHPGVSLSDTLCRRFRTEDKTCQRSRQHKTKRNHIDNVCAKTPNHNDGMRNVKQKSSSIMHGAVKFRYNRTIVCGTWRKKNNTDINKHITRRHWNGAASYERG